MKISDYSIYHPVVITILLIASILFGMIAFNSLRIEMFSNVGLPSVMILTIYPGVGPSDVEKDVTNIIEKAVSTLSGIRDIESQSVDSLSIVEIKFDWGVILDLKLPEIREKINEVYDQLPDGIEGIPKILKMSASNLPVLTVVVKSSLDRASLSDFVERQIKPQLLRITGVSKIDLYGNIKQIVNIKLHVDLLSAKGISVLDIYKILKYSNISFPAGQIIFKGQEINLRTYGEFNKIDEIKNLVIGYKDGSFIRLKDVADVSITNKRLTYYTYSRGKNILVMNVYRQQDKDTIRIIKSIKKRLKHIESSYGGIITFKYISDQAKDIKIAVNSVRNSAIQGGLLAVLILFLFLRNIRATLIISISLPLSILFTFIAMKIKGMSINLMTLGGLTVAIGMIVDSSIVVLENIYKIFSKKKDKKIAASEGTDEVAGAIIASTLTSLAVFVPILFVKGFAGIVLKDVSFTVVFALSSSLLVAIVVVPYLSAILLKERTIDDIVKITDKKTHFNKFLKKISKIFKKISSFIDFLLNTLDLYYKKALEFSIDNRGIIFLIAISVLIISVFIFNFLGFEFLSETDMDEIQLKIQTPAGYTLKDTERKVIEIEKIIEDELKNELDDIVFYVGIGDDFGTIKAPNLVFGKIRLKSHKYRKRSVFQIIDILNKRIKSSIPDVKVFVINGGLGALTAIAMGGQGFMIEVYGNNFNKVYKTAKMIEKIFKENPLISKAELNVRFDRQEMIADLMLDYMGNLGITPYEAAISTRILFHGIKAGIYRTPDKNYDIELQSDLVDKKITEDVLNRITLKSASGKFISFANIADLKLKLVASNLRHKNKMKSIIVTGYLKKANLKEVEKTIVDSIKKLSIPIGVNWEITGQAKEMAESFKALFYALLISIFLVYMVMVIQFERFTQPLIILGSIPFTVIGVALGLLIGGSTLSIVSFMGIIMLSGIVVNNAIVMIDYTNLLRNKYKIQLREAVINGSSSRLRPILMTVFTTFLGVLPMALGVGEGSEMYAPLGQAVAGGLLTSTLITLFLIPSIYYSIEKRKEEKNKNI